MVLSQTDRKQSDSPPPPIYTGSNTSLHSSPFPPRLSPFLPYCGAPLTHPPQLYTRQLDAPGDLVHLAVIWMINDELDVSKEDYFARLYRIFYNVKIVDCVTRAHLKGLWVDMLIQPPCSRHPLIFVRRISDHDPCFTLIHRLDMSTSVNEQPQVNELFFIHPITCWPDCFHSCRGLTFGQFLDVCVEQSSSFSWLICFKCNHFTFP